MIKNSEDKQPFGSFPICFLRYEKNEIKRIDKILSYCIVEYASSFELYEDEEPNQDQTIPNDFDESNELHIKMLKVANKFNCKLGSIRHNIIEHEEFKIIEDENKYQPYARLTLRFMLDTLIEVRKGNNKAYEFFSFVAAIKAMHGTNKQVKFFTIDRIRLAMNGYKGRNEFELMQNKKEYINYSDSKIKRLKLKAEERNFFASYTYHRRNTYYSTYYTKDELAKIVDEKRSKKSKIQEKNLELELELLLEEQKRLDKMKDLKTKIAEVKQNNNKKIETKSLLINEYGSFCLDENNILLYSQDQINEYRSQGLQVNNFKMYRNNGKNYYYKNNKWNEDQIDTILRECELIKDNSSVTNESKYANILH